MANRIALTMVFTLSFASYLSPDLTLSMQIAPLALFALIVIVRVFFSKDLLAALESLVAIDSLVYVLFVSLLVIVPSMQSEFDKSFAFSIVLSSCLILARLYMAVVPVSEVLEAFFWSGVISVTIFLPLVFTSLLESIRTLSRFTAFSFHPNLLAFVLGGYFCAMVWKFLSGGWVLKLIAAPVGLVCLVVIFFASSRGSILAIIGGFAVVAWISVGRLPKKDRLNFLKKLIVTIALVSAIGMSIQNAGILRDGFDAADAVLALTDPNRGVDSGFTGRLDKWQVTMNTLSDGSWLIGHGIRSSDMQEQLIDNSYLVMLYEVGIAPLLLVVWRYADILRQFIRHHRASVSSAERRLQLAGVLFMVVFLTSNVFARFLLSVGNPCSLLAAFIFVTPLYPTCKVVRVRLNTSAAL
jgi:O-Antigen ligase